MLQMCVGRGVGHVKEHRRVCAYPVPSIVRAYLLRRFISGLVSGVQTIHQQFIDIHKCAANYEIVICEAGYV